MRGEHILRVEAREVRVGDRMFTWEADREGMVVTGLGYVGVKTIQFAFGPGDHPVKRAEHTLVLIAAPPVPLAPPQWGEEEWERWRRALAELSKSDRPREMGGGGYAIALLNHPETVAELEAMGGWEKREVYLRYVNDAAERASSEKYGLPPLSPEDGRAVAKNAGDNLFFRMRHPPLQFVTTDSWWGAGEL